MSLAARASATRNRLIGAADWYGGHRTQAAIRPDSAHANRARRETYTQTTTCVQQQKMSQGVIKKLAQHGAAALKPRKVPTAPGQVNPWRRPLVSRREAAVARKQALRDGTFGTFDPEKGGWLREWDPVRAPRVLIPPKGHKRDRTRAERFRNVEARLRDMPRLIEEHRKAVQARKPPPGVETLLKRLVRRRK